MKKVCWRHLRVVRYVFDLVFLFSFGLVFLGLMYWLLFAALQLSSVGLDVFPSEPTINPRLLANERLTLLPHMGTETEETQKKMELLTLDNLISGIEKGRLLTPVWEQKGKL